MNSYTLKHGELHANICFPSLIKINISNVYNCAWKVAFLKSSHILSIFIIDFHRVLMYL